MREKSGSETLVLEGITGANDADVTKVELELSSNRDGLSSIPPFFALRE